MAKISLTFELPDRITDDVRAQLATELARFHRRGYSVRELVKATGKSASWVQDLLAEAGVNLSARERVTEPLKPATRKPRTKKTRSKTLSSARRVPPLPPAPVLAPAPAPAPATVVDLTISLTAPGSVDAEAFAKTLGDELRATRKRRGLTRRQLMVLLPGNVSTQTIATWELGSRQVPAVRVYQFCRALGESMEDVYARVRQRIERHSERDDLWIDIAALVDATNLGLAPLCAWAQVQLNAAPDRKVVALSPAAIDGLARLCNVSKDHLRLQLLRSGIGQSPA